MLSAPLSACHLGSPRRQRSERKLSAMTLCLAAVCDSGESLACVFDQQLTLTTTAADVLSKAARVNERWLLLYAGDDIAQVGTVYDRVKRRLLNRRAVTLPEAQNAVASACDEVIRENLEHGPLAPLNVTVPNFLKRSHQLVDDEDYRGLLMHQVQVATLGSDFLLVGFDERDQPHIVTLEDGRKPTNHDRHGYGWVGSGAIVAQHHVVSLGYTKHLPKLAAGYVLCAAKFTAESAYISKTTHLSVLRKDGSVWTLDTDAARRVWEDKCRPRVPVGIESLLPPLKPLHPPTRSDGPSELLRQARQQGLTGPKPVRKGRRPSRA